MSKMISLTDQGAFISSEPLNPEDYINLTLSAQLNFFEEIVASAPEDKQEEVTEFLYDMYNLAASAFLETFAPEIELRPDLTVEAILEAENQLLDQQAKE